MLSNIINANLCMLVGLTLFYTGTEYRTDVFFFIETYGPESDTFLYCIFYLLLEYFYDM